MKILLMLLMLTGCSLFQTSLYYTNNEIQSSIKQYIGNITEETSRAVIPIWKEDVELNTEGTKSDYPFKGQITNWVVEEDDYRKIIATTIFPEDDFIKETIEIYYLNSNDEYVNDEGVKDSTYREEYKTVYNDNSIREEIIYWDSTIENEVMTFDITGKEDLLSDLEFSSEVHYNQEDGIISNNINITGKRFYGFDGINKEYIWIKEEGFAVNVLLNNTLLRGRVDIEGNIWSVVEDGVLIEVNGYYNYNHKGIDYKVDIIH